MVGEQAFAKFAETCRKSYLQRAVPRSREKYERTGEIRVAFYRDSVKSSGPETTSFHSRRSLAETFPRFRDARLEFRETRRSARNIFFSFVTSKINFAGQFRRRFISRAD